MHSAAVLLVGTAVFAAAPALAVFNDVTDSASMPVSSTSLAAPTGLIATPSCVLVTARVTLSWTATPSTFATGYQIWRKSGTGSFALVGTVSDRTTTTYVNTPVSLSTTYTYYVAAVVHSWSADSTTAAATTPALCL